MPDVIVKSCVGRCRRRRIHISNISTVSRVGDDYAVRLAHRNIKPRLVWLDKVVPDSQHE